MFSIAPEAAGKLQRFTTSIATKARKDGPAAAVRLATDWISQFACRQMRRAGAKAYDRRYGLDTVAEHEGTEFPEAVTYDDAVYYERVPARLFSRALKSTSIEPRDFAFIDLGCGKGAAILLALTHGFRSAVGVELNSRLIPIARSNVARFTAARHIRCDVEIVEGDVIEFRFPETPSVVFLYNPFGLDTTTAVVKNLEESLRRAPRKVVVVYISPVNGSVLRDSPLFMEVPSRSRRWAIYTTH